MEYITLGKESSTDDVARSGVKAWPTIKDPKPKRRRRRPTVKQLNRLHALARYAWIHIGERRMSEEDIENSAGDHEAVKAFGLWIEGQSELTERRKLK